jgi:hypothetical protein
MVGIFDLAKRSKEERRKEGFTIWDFRFTILDFF